MSPFRRPQVTLRGHSRRGAVLVEAAIVLSVFLTIVLGTLDLAVAVLRYNTISAVARQGTREAIVHGEFAPPRRTAWGPATFTGTAADNHEIAQAVQPAIVVVDPSSVSLLVEWPDGSNAVGKRVRYTVTTTYQPVLTSLFGSNPLTLRATSTMFIVH